MEGRIPCSVPILTLNARPHLERLLPMLQAACDDVFIVDGNSTDGTVEYARSLGVRVERQFDHADPNTPITDFTAARLRSWSFARHPWMFLVDADEEPTPELLARVREIVASGDSSVAHRFQRIARLPDGRTVQRAFFYPEETMIRLFHADAGVALATDRKVHERFTLPPHMTVARHPEAFLHTWPNRETFYKKLHHYIALEYDVVPGNFTHRLKWVVWYNLRSAIGQCVRAVWCSLMGALHRQTVLPWAYTWPLIAYRFRAIRQGLRQRVS
jgi:glycosyltransferase involved in cell wall biosynthesis